MTAMPSTPPTPIPSPMAQLHRDVAFGQAGGKVLWQPRIGCWYHDKRFAGASLPAPYTGMSIPEIYRALGCSARLYEFFNRCFFREEHEDVRREDRTLNATDKAITIHTPVGNQFVIQRTSPNMPHPRYLKWPAEDEEELRVAAWRAAHEKWLWDQTLYEQRLDEVGDLGAPTVYLPRMTIQNLYIEVMGVENAVYALADFPKVVEEYFAALEGNMDRLIEAVAASPIEIINFGENIHAGTLSPDLFTRYHLPACRRHATRLREAGKFVSSHWDGDCRALLPFARETGLDGIEAITPAPQGDVTLAEVEAALGHEIVLLDGIPAVYFDEIFSVSVLEDCVHELIERFAPRLVLGISDEISSTGDIERIRIVGEIVDRYNAACDKKARDDAIADSNTPEAMSRKSSQPRPPKRD